LSSWYFFDAWKWIASTWGTGNGWTRVTQRGPVFGRQEDASREFGSMLLTSPLGSFIRTFRWDGARWVFEQGMSQAPTGQV
jgi:hypothetical protein